MTDGS
jgi:hypothetical protein